MNKGLLFFFTMDISDISLKKEIQLPWFIQVFEKKKVVFNIDGNFREIYLRSWHLDWKS